MPVSRFPETVTGAAVHPRGEVVAAAAQKRVDDGRHAIFIEPLRPHLTPAVESFVLYGNVASGFRIDEVGGRLPIPAEELVAIWKRVQPRSAEMHLPVAQLDWYRQRLVESGAWIAPKIEYLERILRIAPNDVDARTERAAMYRINGDEKAFVEAILRMDADRLLGRMKLDPRTTRQWAGALAAAGQPRIAYALLSRIRGDEPYDAWLRALTAGEGAERRRHCLEAVRIAKTIASRKAAVEEQWNAAQYAARACLLEPDATRELESMVELAASITTDRDMRDTLAILQAAVALRRNELTRARELLKPRRRYLLANTLYADLLLRTGDRDGASTLLGAILADPSLRRMHADHLVEVRAMVADVARRL